MSPETTATPEHGSTAWLRGIAMRLKDRSFDLWALGLVDRDMLTAPEIRQVDTLLAEIRALAAPSPYSAWHLRSTPLASSTPPDSGSRSAD